MENVHVIEIVVRGILDDGQASVVDDNSHDLLFIFIYDENLDGGWWPDDVEKIVLIGKRVMPGQEMEDVHLSKDGRRRLRVVSSSAYIPVGTPLRARDAEIGVVDQAAQLSKALLFSRQYRVGSLHHAILLANLRGWCRLSLTVSRVFALRRIHVTYPFASRVQDLCMMLRVKESEELKD